MLIVVTCSKIQCFQQVSFSFGVQQEIMLRVYLIEITSFSFCLAAYDKPTPWHICLHGDIDGGSHFLLWVVVFVDKKKQKKIARYSIDVANYGYLVRVQLDCVAKHSFVREDMERAKPNVYKPYLTSSLVHNLVQISLILEIVLCLLNILFFIIH
jgi:hypothetical protein